MVCLKSNMLVRVYRNLRKNVYSIMDPSTRRVIGHASNLVLRDVRFIVQEGGRQRVLRDKQKNVHAFIEGNWIKNFKPNPMLSLFTLPSELIEVEVRYNPYKMDKFHTPDGKKLKTAKYVKLTDGKVIAVGPFYY